jgi:hypothetical protein
MGDSADFQRSLSDALAARRDWFEKTELPRLKEEFRVFHTGFTSLYNVFIKKGLVPEDPYKQEAKIGEIEVPETGSFSDVERQEQLTIRFSNFDNQLDFLVNFYQFSVDSLSLDKIKRVLGLVKYIDWAHFSSDAPTQNTKSTVELVAQSKNGADPLTLSVINESMANLKRTTGTILAVLKQLTDLNRELYKLELRTKVTVGMSPQEAALPQVKKKFAAAMPGKPFYPDLAEEVIREDYTKDGPALREKILKQLEVPDNKPKIVKAAVSFKSILVEGLQVVCSAAATFGEVAAKLAENEALLANRQIGFWDKVKKIMKQMMNKESEPTIYDVEYMDTARGIPVKEKINFQNFCSDMDKKTRNLAAIGARVSAASKANAMEESQLLAYLEKSIREAQSLHKLLGALDDFFKAAVDKGDREKVKGIKPELATIKNAIIRANQKRHEYSAQKEEEEQLRRLGVSSGG